MKTYQKVAIAGIGAYVVSSLLRAANKASASFAPKGIEGFDTLMTEYDPAAEAIGCAGDGSFMGLGELQGFGSKLKKRFKKNVKKVSNLAVKKPLGLAKKAVSMPQAQLKKGFGLVKRDFGKATQPLIRDFRKGASLMETDFRRAGALFGRGGRKGPSHRKNPQGRTVYLDENGKETGIPQMPGAVASNDDSPTFAIDDVAAEFFKQQQNEQPPGAHSDLDVLASFASPAQTGFADGTAPYTGNDLWQFPDGDVLNAAVLPEDVRDDTMDVFAGMQTSGDSLIMPAGEPSTPFIADELYIGYDDDDALTRGASWTPEPSGSNYGNPAASVPAVPGYWQDYGGFDWDWQADGLGDLVIKPNSHHNTSPAVLTMLRSQQRPNTYGYFLRQPHERPIKLKADKRGMVYAQNGGTLHRVGPLSKLANALGLGCECFGRDVGVAGLGGWGDWRKKIYKGAEAGLKYGSTTGLMVQGYKKVDKKHYKEGRKAAKFAKPYALIAGGTVLTVASAGTAAPATAAMIASGVASLATQGYKDYSEYKAEKEMEHLTNKAIREQREAEALDSTNVLEQTQRLSPSGGPAPGEIPGGDWPWEYPGDGVIADFLNLTDSFIS